MIGRCCLVAAAFVGCGPEVPLPIADVHVVLTGPGTVQEGQQATLSARLEGEPLEPLMVALHTTAPDRISISPSTFMLAAGAPVAVTLTTTVDVDVLDEEATITAAADDAPAVGVDLTVVDRTRVDRLGWPVTADSRSLENGRVYAWPIEIGSSVTLDRIGVAALVAGGPVRLALYRDQDGGPGPLAVGMIIGAEEALGAFEADLIDHALQPGHYWLAIRARSGASVPMAQSSGPECIRHVPLPNFTDPWPPVFGASLCATGRPAAAVLVVRSQF